MKLYDDCTNAEKANMLLSRETLHGIKMTGKIT